MLRITTSFHVEMLILLEFSNVKTEALQAEIHVAVQLCSSHSGLANLFSPTKNKFKQKMFFNMDHDNT